MDASHSQHKSNAHNPLTRRILFLTLYLFVGSLFTLSGASSVWADGNSDTDSDVDTRTAAGLRV